MRKTVVLISSLLICLIILVLDYFNIIPKKTYSNDYFNIETYISNIDKDNDGIDDQTDILESARKYIETKPIYKSKYYSNGYPDDQYGVCTDVIAFALLNSGYDIKTLLNDDVKNNKEFYNIDVIDKNIDFRRVVNLYNYFKRNTISLTIDINDIEKWQAGDIVVFEKHIGIISDKRNKKGIPYLIHNAGGLFYEEDTITRYKIIGHFRIS